MNGMSGANVENCIEGVVSLRDAVGVKCANCQSCVHLGSEGDGYEYNGTWPVCSKIDRMGYLKSFPFKKEMKCWEPDFWHTKFAEGAVTSDGEIRQEAIDAFHTACDSVTG